VKIVTVAISLRWGGRGVPETDEDSDQQGFNSRCEPPLQHQPGVFCVVVQANRSVLVHQAWVLEGEEEVTGQDAFTMPGQEGLVLVTFKV